MFRLNQSITKFVQNIQMNYNIVLVITSINQFVAFAEYPGENDYNHVAPGVPPQAYNPPPQQGKVRKL